MTMLLVPMYVPSNLTIEGMLVGPKREGITTLFGWWGHEQNREPVSGVVFDWPDRYRPLSGDRSRKKRRNELRQMNRLRADLKKDRADPFRAVRAADVDPPDFICEAPALGGKVGVELTQLTLQERAEDHALFQATKSRLTARIAETPSAYAHLRGDLVTIHFSEPDGSPRKPVRTSTGEEAVLSALRNYSHPPAPDGEAPKEIDPKQVMKFDGGSLSGMELPGPLLTPTFHLVGFELALASFSIIRQKEAWSRAVERISDHDKPGVDILVLIAGSTTSADVAFPGDMVLVKGVLAAAATNGARTRHIRRIWIHSWPERVVYELTPGSVGTKVIAGTSIDLRNP
jgi:hypothetical protein